ncbi:MAG TPA: tRNA (adenosine(37)-N6)-threonylcarbamoyltransferase complex dimerization subunit type 1 TsaB [Gemmatimonadaceae bacterium]|nr:tRNA (adenosine(37)-N6)-threonylcarbamoyltransferase complex dimerization subunit type 1 TsaB [Gemmatimonadaceae bacterium]
MTTRVQLAIDGSAGPASIALFIDDRLRQHRRIDRQGSAELLAPAIADALQAEHIEASMLTDVIVGGGPGSFTGLRVVAALGKGLARGAGARLHAVPSLPLIAAANPDAAVGRYFCVIDALRGEWFTQQVSCIAAGTWRVDGAMELLASGIVRERAQAIDATIVGPPIDVLQQPDAIAALRIGVTGVSLDAWEPEYGRLAEAQVKWEAAHARPLPSS